MTIDTTSTDTMPLYQIPADELRELQLTQLEMLQRFADFCRSHELEWQIAAGTLLGAVRHQGFIPWDDDIDVIMPREDYELLCQMADEVPMQFFLQNYRTEPNCPFLYSKLRLNNTLFIEPEYEGTRLHQGIFIDIFPFDRIDETTKFGRFHLAGSRLLHRAYLFASVKDSRQIGLQRSFWQRQALQLAHRVVRMLPRRWLFGLCNRWFGLLQRHETDYWMCLVDAPLDTEKFYQRRARDVLIRQTRNMLFEGRRFPATAYPIEMLRRVYGKFEELPPESERVPHHAITALVLPTSLEEITKDYEFYSALDALDELD